MKNPDEKNISSLRKLLIYYSVEVCKRLGGECGFTDLAKITSILF